MNRKQNTIKLIQNLKTMVEADIQLRKSQVDAIKQFINNPDQPEKGVFNLATGIGKTRIMSMLTLAHLQDNPDGKVIVVVPNTELIEQEKKAFQEYRDVQEDFRKQQGLDSLNIPRVLNMGAFYTSSKDTRNQIIFTTYSSLGKLKENINPDEVGLLLLDEAHHGVSEKRTLSIQSFSNAIQFGMTATPFYDQERDTEKVIGPIIAKRDVAEAIKEGDLAECKNVLMVSNLSVDLSDAHSGNNDFREGDFYQAVAKALHGNSATSDNKENWQQAHHYLGNEVAKFYYEYVDEHVGKLQGKKCLINCRSQEEARIQAQELNKLFGRMVARVHTSDECDDVTIKDFKEGTLLIVCQVGKLTEGFDMPNLDMTINYPTCSLVREAQGAARCLRKPKTTLNQTQKKLGLVVDIAFKHPKYESIVDSIHQNGQVLFQDILGGVIIQHNDEFSRVEELDKDTLKKMKEESEQEGITLNFQIVSEVQELVKLANEEKKLKERRFVEEIPEGMLTHIDLAKMYHKSTDRVEIILATLHSKKIFIHPEDDKEDPFPMVMIGKKHGVEVFAVKNTPIILKKLEEMYPELIPTKDIEKVGFQTLFLEKRYHINSEVTELLLTKLFENKVTFYKQTDLRKELPIPVVKKVRKGQKMVLVVDQDPMALKRIEELSLKLAQRLKCLILDECENIQDYICPKDFIYAFGIEEKKAEEILQKSFKAHDTFFEEDDGINKKSYPLVIPAISGTKMILVLPNNNKAKMKIRELYSDLIVPPYRHGMVPISDFKCGRFPVRRKKGEPALQYLFDNNVVFYLDEDTKHEHPIPFVERVRYGYGLPFLALTEVKKGQELFIGFAQCFQAQSLTEKETIGTSNTKERTSTFNRMLTITSTGIKCLE